MNRRVDLEASELDLLLKACKKYRSTLPSYLLSVQDELGVLDAVIEKLAQARETSDGD